MTASTVQIAGDHYKDMVVQPSHFIHANKIGWHEGNAIKYLCRWRVKGGVEDLKKAIHFIQLLIEEETPAANRFHIQKFGDGWALYCGPLRYHLNTVLADKGEAQAMADMYNAQGENLSRRFYVKQAPDYAGWEVWDSKEHKVHGARYFNQAQADRDCELENNK